MKEKNPKRDQKFTILENMESSLYSQPQTHELKTQNQTGRFAGRCALDSNITHLDK
jgi:hypothetical protein